MCECMRLLTGVIQLLSNLSFISSGGRKPPREKEAMLCFPHKKVGESLTIKLEQQ